MIAYRMDFQKSTTPSYITNYPPKNNEILLQRQRKQKRREREMSVELYQEIKEFYHGGMVCKITYICNEITMKFLIQL